MAITLGFKTNSSVYIASETTLASGILKIKDDENPTISIGKNVIASFTGDQADTFRARSYVESCAKLAALKYKAEITPELVARMFSSRVHESIRERPIDVQGIVGGLSEDKSLRLFAIDKYGASHEDNFVVTGYGLYFLLGIFDLHYKPVMTEEESKGLIMHCLKALKEKLVLDTSKWRVDVIGQEGRRTEFVDLSGTGHGQTVDAVNKIN